MDRKIILFRLQAIFRCKREKSNINININNNELKNSFFNKYKDLIKPLNKEVLIFNLYSNILFVEGTMK